MYIAIIIIVALVILMNIKMKSNYDRDESATASFLKSEVGKEIDSEVDKVVDWFFEELSHEPLGVAQEEYLYHKLDVKCEYDGIYVFASVNGRTMDYMLRYKDSNIVIENLTRRFYIRDYKVNQILEKLRKYAKQDWSITENNLSTMAHNYRRIDYVGKELKKYALESTTDAEIKLFLRTENKNYVKPVVF